MLKRIFALFSGQRIPGFSMPPEDELQTTPSGLKYVVLDPGAGRAPTSTDVVTVRYAGWHTDGRLFDASYPGKATFPLGRVISGWNEGVQLLMVGGRIKLIVPPDLGYGPRGAPPKIGPNETLVFEIELLKVG